VNSATKAFLQRKFGEYYLTARLELPPQFSKREWAFVLFDPAYPKLVMRRHKAFSSAKECLTYLSSVIPAHAYYSTACYAYPSATRMQDKKWEGADVIFDLDADKVVTEFSNSYAHVLKEVKNETAKLVDFLIHDFSVDPKEITIVFSGGRGYHVHLRESSLAGLGSHERREIVNYLTGTGLEAEYILMKLNNSEEIANTCWEIRINRWISRYFESLRLLERQTATKELSAVKNIGRRRAQNILDALAQGSNIPPLVQSKLLPASAWKGIVREAISDLRVRIDMPVTADTKRLIRLPTSLHGGSGLLVTPLTFADFDHFEPLRDAVVFSEDLVPIKVLKPAITEIKGETIKVDHSTKRLPEHTAIYLMARGLAEYESGRSKNHQKR